MIVRISITPQSALGNGGVVTRDMTTPRDCVWKQWSAWSECTAACGKDANMTRTRSIEITAGPGGAVCYLYGLLTNLASLALAPTARGKLARVLLVLLNALGLTGANGLLVL
jgi:hypothetical protein